MSRSERRSIARTLSAFSNLRNTFCRRRPRPAVDYLDPYFAAGDDDYEDYDYYDGDVFAAIEYQKALQRKRNKAAIKAQGKSAAEKDQVKNG